MKPSFLIAISLILLLHSPVLAQQRAALAAKADPEPWKTYYQRRAASDYEFVWSDERTPLELKSAAIVNWTNPLEKGQIHGSTFVWEVDGRPLVIGQIFSYLNGSGGRSLCHVFATLTDQPVLGRRNGQLFWDPAASERTGWQVAQAAPTPAEHRQGRLLQMRRLARQFEASTEEQSRGKRNLRLLPQPLYRSDAAAKNLDCGLFAYVVGTDPELMVLIECDPTDEEPRWRYRFAQSTRSTTVASFMNQEVYRYQSQQNDPQSARAVYYSRHGVEVIPAEFE